MSAPTHPPPQRVSRPLILLLVEIAALIVVFVFAATEIRDSLLIAATAIIAFTAGYWLAGLHLFDTPPTAADDRAQNRTDCADVLKLTSGFIQDETDAIQQETLRVKTLIADASPRNSRKAFILSPRKTSFPIP